ncbi:Ras GTPase-activating protein, putative [Pediculus humanus corporis]|uniref:Ras GTPase-activating protein, putative n=1 Tax=Pediculus humanus subsp. corporis TaxID=121224 RepID=E0VM79_PEDHC|nr:Ras GTPase-activating protein, putative [Pediculus humanus corporis]EEB14485.1 Ras GTPase-activating protein, putative [Pediculus humanus corporis]
MADQKREVRVEERLKIKIGEAKNLPSRHQGGPGGYRDVFCALTLDQEEIFRTTTVERTLNPFFGEEFQFEIPRRFRYLSVYVYDRDKNEKVIGKVAIKREDLTSYNNKDHWFQLKNVDCDSEVQGKCQVGVKLESSLDANGDDKVVVRLLECSDLTLKGGSCDPFATVTMVYSNGKQDLKRTKVKKKTNSPKFDETFTFEVCQNHDRDTYQVHNTERDVEFSEVLVTLWHDSPGMSDNLFLGEVRIPVRVHVIQQYGVNNAWYYLQPRSNKSRSSSKSQSVNSTLKSTNNLNELGSIRLKMNYEADHVFPSQFYEPLRKILLESSNMKPVTSSAAYILGEIVTSKMEAAQPLVRIMTHHGQIVSIIKALAKWEISKVTDANTIFRGNTLVSKMMDEVMRLAGSHYLRSTLKPSLEVILSEKKNCEIDPTRVKDTGQIETNLANLKEYVEKVFKSITSSSLSCPTLMCELFQVLKELAIERFPNNNEVRYSVISGFIFLRFFAPAILGPKLFDLTSSPIDQQTNRTLTLISKTMQSLGNLVSCKYKTSGLEQHKEKYMSRLLESFQNPPHIEAVRQFLEIISASSRPNGQSCTTFAPVVLKEGIMVKRAQGRKRFGRKNFKQRYFRLTTQDLSYSKAKGKEPLCCIPLSQILAVERLNEDSFKMKNMFQIIQSERRMLYVQANNCVEEKEWIDILTKICQTNTNRLERFHPSAFINGKWLCCNKFQESAQGCQEVTRRERLEMTLDPDRELQRIHSIIISQIKRLETLISGCYYYNHDSNAATQFKVEDVNSYLHTLNELKNISLNLEQEHRIYQRQLARETKYGSKQAPIGDNNYLLLATRSPFDPTVTLRNYDSWKIGSTSSMPAMMPTRSCTSFRSARPGADGESNVYTILKYDYSPACGQCDTSTNVQLTTGSTVEDSSSSGKRLYEKKDIVHQGKKPSFPERVCTS